MNIRAKSLDVKYSKWTKFGHYNAELIDVSQIYVWNK